MEDLVKHVLNNKLSDIVAPGDLDFDPLNIEQKTIVITCAIHCVLNGPVGVNKETNFPVVGKATINRLIVCTNRTWKKFCFRVAEIVKRFNANIECNTIRKNREYWPIHEW
jgi:hypothetical protein